MSLWISVDSTAVDSTAFNVIIHIVKKQICWKSFYDEHIFIIVKICISFTNSILFFY